MLLSLLISALQLASPTKSPKLRSSAADGITDWLPFPSGIQAAVLCWFAVSADAVPGLEWQTLLAPGGAVAPCSLAVSAALILARDTAGRWVHRRIVLSRRVTALPGYRQRDSFRARGEDSESAAALIGGSVISTDLARSLSCKRRIGRGGWAASRSTATVYCGEQLDIAYAACVLGA